VFYMNSCNFGFSVHLSLTFMYSHFIPVFLQSITSETEGL